MKSMPILFALFCFFQLHCIYSFALTKDTQNVIFIFDASGSMWGKLEKSTKIQIAKKTMGELLGKLNPQTKAGLIVYGHRSKDYCEDIEIISVLAANNTAVLNAFIQKLEPTGKTPIAASIDFALESIQNLNENVSIVLISDGLETCGGDACESVAIAKKNGMKITMHVIGFGIEEQDLSSLECLAQMGGGRYFPANSASELVEALEESIKPATEGNSILSVLTTLEGNLQDASVVVYKKGVKKEVAAGRTYSSKKTNPRTFQLEAGHYNVEVKPVRLDGNPGITEHDIILGENDTINKSFEFQQGMLELLVTRNGELSDATIELFVPGEKKATVTARSYENSGSNPAKLKVPPGVYDVVLSAVKIDGRPVKKFSKVEIKSAEHVKLSHDYSTGDLVLGARKGKEYVDVAISLLDAEGKSVAGGRTYQSASSNPKTFVLVPGKYKLNLNPVKPKGLAPKSIEIVIKAGEKTEKVLEW